MVPQVRYQVFVSSTYEDLREERQQATQAVLEAGCFPSGMELFPASDDAQWDLIKRVIEESDYYVLIVAGRYGSLGPAGLSYTEMEYDYAVERGIPVLGFIHAHVGDISFQNTEQSDEGRKKLEAFRQKVTTRTCRKYNSPAELGMAVLKSLMAEVRVRPRIGWIRADQARSEEDAQREHRLVEELNQANEEVERLERVLRDRSVLGDEIPRDTLLQGDDICRLTITYAGADKIHVSEEIELTWDEIFKIIGSSLYGYIAAKRTGYYNDGTYPFQDDIEQHIRARIIGRVQNRKVKMQPSQIDACILQFKELGLLQFAEKDADGKKFRGVTLTEEGERRLSLLSTRKHDSDRKPSARSSKRRSQKNKA